MTEEKLETEIDRVIYADHNDPFSILGMHKQLVDGTEKLVVRAFLPQARKVSVVELGDRGGRRRLTAGSPGGVFRRPDPRQ